MATDEHQDAPPRPKAKAAGSGKPDGVPEPDAESSNDEADYFFWGINELYVAP